MSLACGSPYGLSPFIETIKWLETYPRVNSLFVLLTYPR